MITGFNTDIEHDGVVYHVQTEDKGLDSPIILSLVYSGGAILASKRAPYEDLLASGFSEAALAERLKRQHTLICAAIHAGRIEDLKRMATQASRTSSRTEELELTPGPPEYNPVVAETAEVPPLDEIEFTPAPPEYQPVVVKTEEAELSSPALEPKEAPEPKRAPEPVSVASGPGSLADVYTVHDSRRQSPLGDLPSGDQGLVVSLMDEQDFCSGESLSVNVRVCERTGNAEKPLHNVPVSLKVLGTAFRPQIYTTKTGRNGVATIAMQIPQFTTGRAAILIRAVAQGNSTEIRRLVHPGK